MYRKPSPKRQAELSRRLEAMRRGKDRARMAREPEPRGPDLPLLRREVVVIDYDNGQPVTHTLHLYRTNRVDRYRVDADGKPWKCCGWSVALAGLRKAYQRLPSPRSSFWGQNGYSARDEEDARRADLEMRSPLDALA